MDDHSRGNQTFSHEEHYILSSELKHLYVAITRTRERLFIFDKDTELSEPIRTYWKRKGLVNETKEYDFSKFGKDSNQSDLYQDGNMYFERQNYKQVKLLLKYSLLCNNELAN